MIFAHDYYTKIPKTGDEGSFTVVIVLAVLSLLAGCGVFFVGRRKRERIK